MELKTIKENNVLDSFLSIKLPNKNGVNNWELQIRRCGPGTVIYSVSYSTGSSYKSIKYAKSFEELKKIVKVLGNKHAA